MKTASIPDDLAVRAEKVRHNVAKNLSDLLESQRWSRRAAALELGLTHTYVNSRATGATELSSSDVAMFAEFLDVPVSRFFETPTEETTNVTRISRPGSGAGRRNLYLLDSNVGLTGFEPMASTVETGRLAPITPMFRTAI